MSDNNRKYKSAFFMLINPKNDKVMLLRHAKTGLYMLPGGRLDYGETPWQAARREFKEETGGWEAPLFMNKTRVFEYYNDLSKQWSIIYIIYLHDKPFFQVNKEADQMIFISWDNIFNYPLRRSLIPMLCKLISANASIPTPCNTFNECAIHLTPSNLINLTWHNFLHD